jgi:hypothetical protein
MTQRKGTEYVPAAPFADWLNQRLGEIASGTELEEACAILAEEVGWSDTSKQAGIRKLYRFRHQLMSGSVGSVKKERPTDVFTRRSVEEALNHAGLRLGELYPYEALVDEFVMEFAVPRDQGYELADAWIERTWHTAFQDVGRFVLPEHRPHRYCSDCRRTTRVFAGVCEECMAPDKPRILKAVA